MQAMLTCRFTPLTSTVASFLPTSSILTMRPGNSETHGCYPWLYPMIDAVVSRIGCVNETRGADRGLPERESAVVGGDLQHA